MKLSKKDLRRALQGEEETFDIVPNRFSKAVEALSNGTLEIEGYVRADHFADDSKKVDGWIRFDPEDKKTFPKKYPVLVHLDYGGIEICTLFFDEKFQTGVGDSFAPEKITHWRPLPKPPVESEVGK